MEEEKLQPYIAEYSISGKEKCSQCYTHFKVDQLYLSILNQITGHDGLYPTPFCIEHFFENETVDCLKDILHCDKLRPEDEKKIVRKIDAGKNEAKKACNSLPKSVPKVGKYKFLMKSGCIVDPDAVIRAHPQKKEKFVHLSEVGHVYKENDQFYSKVMCMVDVDAGRNSYFKVQLIEKDTTKEPIYWLFRSWGRIGMTCGIKFCDEMDSLDSAKQYFHKICQDKSKVYNTLELEYGNDEARLVEVHRFKHIIKLEPQIQTFVKTILEVDPVQFEVEINLVQMPLFQMTYDQLYKGYLVLDEVTRLLLEGADISKRDVHDKIVALTNRFYSQVPTVFDMFSCPMLDNLDFVHKKVDELEDVMEIELDYRYVETEKNLDAQYKSLECDIVCLDPKSEIWKILENYLYNTHGATHNQFKIKLLNIYSISRHGESELYEASKNLKNKRLLWHGSRISNVASILKNGLKIAPPGAPVTGHAFGKGIYFADMISKSANYCFPDNNKYRDFGALFLCEVALGEIHEISEGGSGCSYTPPTGKNSVKGCGKTVPSEDLVHVTPGGAKIVYGKPVASSGKHGYLQYNEYIVYKREQVKVEFLLEVEFNFSGSRE